MEENVNNKTLKEKIEEREKKEKQAKKKVMKRIFLIVIILLLCDQVTKILFINKDISIIQGILKFHTVQNRGGAFGIGQNSTFSFIVANIIVLGIIIKFISIQANQIDKKTGIALGMVLAGGFSTSNFDYYLYTGNDYWTMSPYHFNGYYASVLLVLSNGNPFGSSGVFNSNGVRPVINLKPNSLKLGDGTATDPYRIEWFF